MASKFQIITYDLCNERNYEKLYEYLKNYNEYAKITESTWLIATQKSSSDIRDEIINIIDDDDRVFVARLEGEKAWKNAIAKNEDIKEF